MPWHSLPQRLWLSLQTALFCLSTGCFMVYFGDLMFVWTFPLSTLILLFSTAEVKGQPQVIGSRKPIIAALGDDVILPCHLQPKLSVERLAVEWSKPDERPSRGEYVHLYRDRQEFPDMKIQAYARRTALFTDALRDGNISLKIMNVTLEDQGRYRCFIPTFKKDAIVHLVVVETLTAETTETTLHPRSLPTPDPRDETDVKGGRLPASTLIPPLLICLFLIPGGGVLGYYLLKHKCLKEKHVKYDAASTESVPV